MIPYSKHNHSRMERGSDYGFDMEFGDRVALGEGDSVTVFRGWVSFPGASEDEGLVTLPAALKFYRDLVSSSPEAPHTLLREVAQLSSLSHPCVVGFLRWFSHQHVPVMATELIEGQSLNFLTEEAHQADANLDEWIWQVVKWAALLASAFQHLEEQKVTHRDVRPSNIIIRDKDRLPVLTGFGFSKRQQRYETGLNASGFFSSRLKHPFASPEQLKGGDSEVSHPSDIYSLGATLWFAVSGALPPDPIPDDLQLNQGPLELGKLLAAMLRQNSEKRPTARQVKEGLIRMLEASGHAGDLARLDDRSLAALQSPQWLPSFEALPKTTHKWIATTLLDVTRIAYWGGEEACFHFRGAYSRMQGRVNHEQAKRIVARINADMQHEPFLYRLVDYAEWKQGAGYLEDSIISDDEVLLQDSGAEYEWCRDTSGECVHVATVGVDGPTYYQRHPLWPKGTIRLIRERIDHATKARRS